jgi:4-amino-4-deoxy-L-arabinose transferase-like glycosyltransferase
MIFSSLLRLGLMWSLLASGLLLPGFLLGRRVGSSAPWLSAYLGSAVILFYLVLGLDTLHAPIGLASLAIGLAGVNGLLLAMSFKTGRAAGSRPTPAGNVLPRGRDCLWLVPPAIALAAVAVRAVVEPLSGFDNVFRWDFLARQILRTGTLDFYPPVSAADFNLYGWCDGIPPLVSSLNLWSYLSAGQTAALATTPRVLLESGLIFHAVWRLARGLGGPAAGWPAVATLAVAPLALWGMAMGQETGLTALTLVAMFVFLNEHQRKAGNGALFWAGLAAGAGALSREYGLAWPAIGLATLAWQGQLRRDGKIFGITSFLIAAPWYLRNWLHTGNPLFSHDLAGIFPTNAVHHELMRTIAALYRVGANPDLVPFGLKALAVTAGITLMLGLAAGISRFRPAAPLFVSATIVGGLWYWSIDQTAGGWVYSGRVLTPALALAAVLGGGLLARAGRRTWIVAALLIPLAVDAGIRSLYLPGDPLVSPAAYSFTRWHELGIAIADAQDDRLWAEMARVAGSSGVMVDDPAIHALLTSHGTRAVPLTSPEAAMVFEPSRAFAEILANLRARDVRFVLLAPHSLLLARFDAKIPFLHELQMHHDPILRRGDFLLYDLQLIPP